MDKLYAWLPEVLDLLHLDGIAVQNYSGINGAVRGFAIDAGNWARTAPCLKASGLRFASLWAEETWAKEECAEEVLTKGLSAEGLSVAESGSQLQLYACLEKQGAYLLLTTTISIAVAEIGSWSSVYVAANGFERHTRDMWGLHFGNSADQRRWTRHKAWMEGQYPLRENIVLSDVDVQTGPDNDYPFHKITGDALYEIPVGPVHAGIIEPGHFRFHAIGETILDLEIRLGYLHKGCEKLAEGLSPEALLRLAGRISGDTTVAHAWAAAQAMEQAAGVKVTERALSIRALLSERERIANHLGDIAAICNDVGFSFAYMQFSRLREDWLRRNQALFGHRLLMDQIVVAGVRHDIDKAGAAEIGADCQHLHAELDQLLPILRTNTSLRGRLFDTGILSADQARDLGCLGFVARASGIAFDLRTAQAYHPYDRLHVGQPLQQPGDVAARLFQRAEEILVSLDLIGQVLASLPDGPIAVPWQTPAAGAAGIGMVEGWRGEIMTLLRFDNEGRIARFFPRDPSWFNWLALTHLIDGNIVPDFPVCNKSINGSYAGVDL